MNTEMIRVLCVEDDALDRELIRHALEKESEGFKMTEGCDRESFESLLDKGDFDVVLTDFNILGFQGLEVIRSVRKRRPEVPIIVVTGTGSEEVAVQSLREGAEDYVIKTPRHIAQLPMTVRRVLQAKRTQDELRERDANFRALVANTADGILVVGYEGKVLFANPAAEEMLGCTSGELVGRAFGHPIGNRYSLEIDLPRKMGGTGTAAMRVAQTVWNKDACYIVSLRDITERRQAEEALREREAFLITLLDAIPIPVFYKDTEGRYLGFNSAFERFFGETRESMIGKAVFDINPPELAETYYARDIELIKKGGTQRYESQLKNVHGVMRDVIFNKAVFTDRQGAIGGLIGGILDITDRKRDEQERERMQSQLLQAQKMESIGRLAGGVAHDFNNKLGVILGYAEMMLTGMTTDDPYYEDLKEIVRAAKQSSALTRQLLAFARKQAVSPMVLDLNETLEGMLKMLRRLIGEDIDLIWKPDTNLWPVNVDPAQIDQILANLCVNARDAIESVGKVTIETQNAILDQAYCDAHAGCVPGEYIMLEVRDSGSGMDKETLANIFEPFFTTKEAGKGTGLGLSTVYGIVKQNQGFIEVTSEPDKGAAFKIYLPRYKGETETGAEVGQPDVPRARGETILLVEDEASVLKMVKKSLEQLGYTMLATEEAKKAVDMVRAHRGHIHLLLTDVVMPGMSGKELAEEIADLRPNTKTLFMSGYANIATLHHGAPEEGVNFIQKPFGPDSLARKVREVIDSEK